MTESFHLCDCCSVRISEDEASRSEALCPDCRKAWQAISDLSPTYKLHVLAAACCPDKEKISRRLDCTMSAHNSGLRHAAACTQIGHNRLVTIARWAMRTGRINRLKVFEDSQPSEPPEAQVVEGIRLVPCDALPGRGPIGKWERILDAFLESGHQLVLVDMDIKAEKVGDSLRDVITRKGLREECRVTRRRGRCYLVRKESA